MKFFFVMAAHNRRLSTLRCLNLLDLALANASVTAEVILFDDGSSDGTGKAVLEVRPSTIVLKGGGDAFWAGAMSRAEGHALALATTGDVVVWLNDDVELDADAVVRMQSWVAKHPARVLVGTVRDPISTNPTYGGLRRRGMHPLSFALVPPHESDAQELDAMNGNLVLIPVSVLQAHGGIDGTYPHGGADIDLGLRLKTAGEPAILMPGTFGCCPRNAAGPQLPLRAAWSRYTSVKGGGNPGTLLPLLRRTTRAPRLWLGVTYATWLARELRPKLSTKRARSGAG